MSQTVYALLVGINDYAPDVGKLEGCLNDVDHFHAYLTSSFDKGALAIEVLKDGDATRANIIRQFRTHLGRATARDAAVFLYCGHGARGASAPEFKQFYPDGKDEGLVCVDSRSPGGFDLADKELAVLLAEVGKNDPHLAVILDCCHSGSGTRNADAFRRLKARQTHEVLEARPLDSYLEGYYAKLKQEGQGEWFSIPASKHILLAACERTQKALEAPDHSGVFTSTLVEVLGKSRSDISYADLFVRCRAAVRARAENQNPQFETHGSFKAFSGFLGRATSGKPQSFKVHYEGNRWKVEAGALHGFPTEPEKSVGLALFREDDRSRAAAIGNASTVVVGPQESDVRLDFASATSAQYVAELTSLPVPPIPVYFPGGEASKTLLREALDRDQTVNATLTDIAPGTQYALSVEAGALLLKQRETDLPIQAVPLSPGVPEDDVARMLLALKHVVRWEKSWALQNHGTTMDTSLLDFVFAEKLADGRWHEYPAGEVILDYVKTGNEWKKVVGKFKVRNRTRQTLHVVFAHFTNKYGLEVLSNEPIPPGGDDVTLEVNGDPEVALFVDDPANETIERFKLMVSTEKVDDFLLEQGDLPIESTRGFGPAKAIKKYEREWFTRSMLVKVVRRLDRVGDQDAKLAQGKIVIKAHPSLRAELSLSAARTATRGAGGAVDFYKALEGQGLDLLNFAGTRGDDESVLELTGMENAASLKENPLEIEVRVPLKDDEGILPVVFDGQHVVLGGDPCKDDNGHTRISIDHVPDVPDRRRSVGGSLKLYFFKTCLKQDNVNQLRWVEYKADGSFEQHKSMVADKVAAARSVLLLVHGIIGDTEGMAQGARAIGLDRRFDLVLTYDYENLSTPIAKTALNLKSQLAAAGLRPDDDKKLTLLVHSMGGLVSRWFIEREGGNKVVDHLVMCGTPNRGSPFGRIDGARKILSLLTSLAMNYVPAFVPYSSAILMLLNRSKKLTPTLEQMNPASDFIQALNRSDDPGIPYTILAGDVDAYHEPSDRFFARMLAKAGQSFIFEALFARQANDIAVGVESILGVTSGRARSPLAKNVACHHLNYFGSAAGEAALTAVGW